MIKLPKNHYEELAIESQRKWIEAHTGNTTKLNTPTNPSKYRGLSENIIGEMSVPVSVAGPLKIIGSTIQGEYYIPICALEGTLALSLTRGLLLTNLCGGIETQHHGQKMNRSPVFSFSSLTEGQLFVSWISDNFDIIKSIAEETTSHGKLQRIECHVISLSVITDFIYSTGDAAGQNMVTFATDRACQFILNSFPAKKKPGYLIESNYSGDKNSTLNNATKGRGHAVTAKVTLKEATIRRILKTSGKKLADAHTTMSLGSMLSGAVGNNLHCANGLAALYLSLGQDLGCIAENASGFFTFNNKDGEFISTLTMNSISVGSMGGATRLPHQQSHLKMLDCYGDGKSASLAEVICSCALALELSLGGAIVNDDFTTAHKQYGR